MFFSVRCQNGHIEAAISITYLNLGLTRNGVFSSSGSNQQQWPPHFCGFENDTRLCNSKPGHLKIELHFWQHNETQCAALVYHFGHWRHSWYSDLLTHISQSKLIWVWFCHDLPTFVFAPQSRYVKVEYAPRGLWTATPGLSIEKETGQINNYFLQAKNIQNWCNFTGKRSACVNMFLTPFSLKKLLLFPISTPSK